VTTPRDIVVRLQRWSHDPDSSPASDIMDEAAAEIERLRRIVSLWSDCAVKTRQMYGGVYVPAECVREHGTSTESG